jgi:hypothetical protein
MVLYWDDAGIDFTGSRLVISQLNSWIHDNLEKLGYSLVIKHSNGIPHKWRILAGKKHQTKY